MKKIYENTFSQGKDLVKKLMVAAIISCVMGVVCEQMGNRLSYAFLVLSIVIFVAVVYVIAKFCRCPHCGKRIFFGVLKVTTCPSCRRNLYTGKKSKKNVI